jgi:hypothetical protein
MCATAGMAAVNADPDVAARLAVHPACPASLTTPGSSQLMPATTITVHEQQVHWQHYSFCNYSIAPAPVLQRACMLHGIHSATLMFLQALQYASCSTALHIISTAASCCCCTLMLPGGRILWQG